ncbi:MAG: RNA polymerase sigma factor [Gemmatimonadales bacterium]
MGIESSASGSPARGGGFPETRPSVLAALAGRDGEQRREAGDLLCRAYRAPVVALVRHRWPGKEADAEDVTHDFFATLLEKDWLARFDPNKGRFRTFLRVCAERFAANWHQAAGRLKRGGGLVEVPLDLVAELVSAEADDDDRRFRDAWVNSVFGLAVEGLRAEAATRGRERHFAIFERYDLADHPAGERPTYRRLAEEHGLSEGEVVNHLAWARRRFRAQVLETLRRLAGSDEEYREDVRELLGVDP